MKCIVNYFQYLLLLTAVVVLSACGDDDIDRNNPIDYGSMVNKSYDITYSVKVADEKVLRDIADLQIEYFDGSGNLCIDTITIADWQKDCYINVANGTKIGLKARWILHSEEELKALAEKESKKSEDNRTTYNFAIDITSPYVSVKSDNTEVESIFRATRTINSKEHTVAAILAGLQNTNLFTEFFYEVVTKESGYTMLEGGAFPKFSAGYEVSYTVRIVDDKVIRDLADLEISYYDNMGELHKQTITEPQVFQTIYQFRKDGSKIGLKARWVFRDRATLDALVANEMTKKESDRIRYSLAIDLTSPYVLINTDGTTASEKIEMEVRGTAYTAQEIVGKLLGQEFSESYGYRLDKENNNMKMTETTDLF